MSNVVVLDKIRSLYNVGSIMRTCDAFGIGHVILCGYTPTPENKRFEHMQTRDPDSAMIAKTALKGLKSVAWSHEDSTVEAIKRLKDEGYFIIAIEQSPTSIPLAKITTPVIDTSLSSHGRGLEVGYEVPVKTGHEVTFLSFGSGILMILNRDERRSSPRINGLWRTVWRTI